MFLPLEQVEFFLHLLYLLILLPTVDALPDLLLKVTFEEPLTSLLFNILEKFDKFFVTDAGPLLDLDQLLLGEDGEDPLKKLLVLVAGQEVDSEV